MPGTESVAAVRSRALFDEPPRRLPETSRIAVGALTTPRVAGGGGRSAGSEAKAEPGQGRGAGERPRRGDAGNRVGDGQPAVAAGGEERAEVGHPARVLVA